MAGKRLKSTEKNTSSRVTIIIPHWNGESVLRRCLDSLKLTRYKAYTILLVDNGSTDNSVKMVAAEFPEVKIVASAENLGFAGGCNLGIMCAETPYVVLLNNDTVVTGGWLETLVKAADKMPDAAALQPKLRSIADPERFDYCGAAGGEMDIFGYPFARGRLFEYIEVDESQYDTGRELFWATGAACLLKCDALRVTGLLDAAYFAHMEEIDLNWRFLLAGYSVRFVPDSVVYHQTGGTLAQDSIRKMVLNHRNSLITLLKNCEIATLLWMLPARLLLEAVTIGGSLLTGRPNGLLQLLPAYGR